MELTNHIRNKSGVILHLAQREREGKREDGPSQFRYCPAEGEVTSFTKRSLLKDQRAGHCSPASKTPSKGSTELTPLFGISNSLMYKAPPHGRWYLQGHATIFKKATQSTGHQILAQTIDSTETV